MKKLMVLSLICATALVGCSSTRTKVRGTWVESGVNAADLGKTLVIGMSKNEGRRRIFENAFAQELKLFNIDASPSYTVMPDDDTKMTESQLKAMLQKNGYDSVIVTRLTDQRTETSYTPGYAYTTPAWYGGFYGYYGSAWNTVYSPGYLSTEQVVTLETNIYHVKDGKLIWAAVSEVFSPEKIDDAVKSFSKAVSKELFKK